FVNGMVYGNWLPRIPELKDQLGLSNTNLGITLLGGGVGGIVGSLLASRITKRLGSRRLLLRTIVPLPVVMAAIPFVGEAWMLLVLLSLIGLIDVWTDLAMNVQGVIAQERLGRSIMNRLHGMWSVGFGSGTLIGSLAGGVGVSFRVQVVVVALSLLVTVGLVSRSLEPNDPAPTTNTADVPTRRRHLGLAAVALAVAGAAAIALEGAPNEWAALLMRDDLNFGEWAGFGTVAFGFGMVVSRLGGDHALERLDDERLFRLAMVVVAVGITTVVLSSAAWLGLAALFVSGLGQGVIFPRLYLIAARVPGMSAGAGLGAMLIGLRLGGMATAVAMGRISQSSSVQTALGVVGVVTLVLLVVSSAAVSRRAA
ncbi:MAG: MFS transporter, partial [Actinobacteria bacterium]|nr:MFS transporter [Actinomycetota bacterium]